jgi:hypothetical protein
MDKQEIFDTVARHLFAQGERAYDREEGTCKYRREGQGKQLKCAVGALIPDDNYDPGMDDPNYSTSIRGVLARADEKGYVLPDYFTKEQELLSALQTVHDYEINWRHEGELKNALSLVAIKYGLSDLVVADLRFPVKEQGQLDLVAA